MRFAITSCILLLIAGCGGSGGSDAPLVETNNPPTISSLADLEILGNGQASATVSVSDDNTSADQLTVSVASDNEVVVPSLAVDVASGGMDRSIAVMPGTDQLGSATITLTVTDATGLTASTSFQVTVRAAEVSVAQFARDAFAADANGEPVAINTLIFFNDAQGDDFADLLQ